MKDVNKLILVGRLGSDPELLETKKGSSFVRFSIATARRYPTEGVAQEGTHDDGANGEDAAADSRVWVTETTWHRVVGWGRLAQQCAGRLQKGDTCYVEGQLKNRRYEDSDGITRTATEVHADVVSFMGKRAALERDLRSELVS